MEKLKEWGNKDGGKLTPDGRVTLGLAYVPIISTSFAVNEFSDSYDLVGFGPVSVHQEILKYAREIPVAVVTAHVVKGNVPL